MQNTYVSGGLSMNPKFSVIETSEGCESFVIATSDFIIRGWLESEDPDLLGGHIFALSFRADKALNGHDEVDFEWVGTREQFVGSLQAFGLDSLAFDSRFRVHAKAPRRRSGCRRLGRSRRESLRT
jgi:hypothetical protein